MSKFLHNNDPDTARAMAILSIWTSLKFCCLEKGLKKSLCRSKHSDKNASQNNVERRKYCKTAFSPFPKMF